MTTMIPRGNLLSIYAFTATLDPAAVATITTAEQTFTVPGLQVGDIVISINKPTNTVGVGIVNARVSAANTLAISFVNPTAGSVNPASESYVIVIGRPEAIAPAFNA